MFNPLYFVFILSMKNFSLSFLTAGSELKIFSKIVTFMSETLCPFWLKCSPVALLIFWLTAYPLCSLNLFCKVRSLSPMYCTVHLSQVIQYNMFLVWQFTCLFISTVKVVSVDLTIAKHSQAPAPAGLSIALFPNYPATRPTRPGRRDPTRPE